MNEENRTQPLEPSQSTQEESKAATIEMSPIRPVVRPREDEPSPVVAEKRAAEESTVERSYEASIDANGKHRLSRRSSQRPSLGIAKNRVSLAQVAAAATDDDGNDITSDKAEIIATKTRATESGGIELYSDVSISDEDDD